MQGWPRAAWHRHQPVQVHAGIDQIRRAVEKGVERSSFPCSHQPQMPRGKDQRLVARNGAETRHTDVLQRPFDHRTMAFAADIVGDHPRHRHIVPKVREALHERSDRMRLPRAIHHQDDRQGEHRRKVCGATRAIGCTVEQAHGRFHHKQPAVSRQHADEIGPHRPGIEIDTGRTAGCRVKGGVNEVRPRFGGSNGHVAASQGAQDRHRDNAFAATG